MMSDITYLHFIVDVDDIQCDEENAEGYIYYESDTGAAIKSWDDGINDWYRKHYFDLIVNSVYDVCDFNCILNNDESEITSPSDIKLDEFAPLSEIVRDFKRKLIGYHVVPVVSVAKPVLNLPFVNRDAAEAYLAEFAERYDARARVVTVRIGYHSDLAAYNLIPKE